MATLHTEFSSQTVDDNKVSATTKKYIPISKNTAILFMILLFLMSRTGRSFTSFPNSARES